MANKTPHRITKIGANHTDFDENGKRVNLGYGDTFMVEADKAHLYDNLGLKPIVGHNVETGSGDRLTDDEDFEEFEKVNPKGPVKSPQGTEDGISEEDLNELIQEVDDSKVGDGTFEAARERVIAADLFEADTLPETKSGVLEALKALKKD